MKRYIIIGLVLIFSSCHLWAGNTTIDKAKKLASKIIILDGHIDVPYRLKIHWEDIGLRTEYGHFDYVKAKAGGLNAPFMSIYIPSRVETEGGAKKLADELIAMVNGFVTKYPDKFAMAASVEEVKQNFNKGLISLPMGIENGAPIEGDLKNVQYFYDKGVRYITLAHSKDNHICDSSYDKSHKWKGLSPFGKTLIVEMNNVGIMIDVAHISDDTFYQVMELSKAPVIASHTSCRHFTPGFERNMDDKMLKLLAKNGGVIQINFGSYFLTKEFQKEAEAVRDDIRKLMKENNIKWGTPKFKKFQVQYRKKHPMPKITIDDLVAHIDHAVKVAGIDHVGLGSDYDGVGDLPEGMEDVSGYPKLIEALLMKGYSETDIQKICSGNVFRVWNQVEAYAKKH
jgi:membrane dipeptidase